MNAVTDAIAIARQMIDRYGHEAAETVDGIADKLRAAGQHEDAAFWLQIARAVRSLQEC